MQSTSKSAATSRDTERDGSAMGNPRLAALLHHKPAALFVAEIERPHGRGFGRLTVRGLHVPENLSALADQRHAPATVPDGGALLFSGFPATRMRRHGWLLPAGDPLGKVRPQFLRLAVFLSAFAAL